MKLKTGSSGDSVKALQQALGITVDGDYGPETEKAVLEFQRANGLDPDGKADSDTLLAIVKKIIIGNKPIVIPSPSGLLNGLDIYHGDNISSWQQIKDHFSFIFIKATESTGYRDPKFVEYWQAAKHVGLATGAYHFMSWDKGSGRAQASNLVKALEAVRYGKGDLPPVCDWEYRPGNNPKSADLVVGKDFLTELSQLTGRRPIIYCSHSVPIELGSPSWLADYPLWLASYRPTPNVPAPWSNYTFWQNAEDAVLPGLKNKGDSDICNLSMDDLLKL